jgi:hypothetical protein
MQLVRRDDFAAAMAAMGTLFLVGCIAAPWIANYLATAATATR